MCEAFLPVGFTGTGAELRARASELNAERSLHDIGGAGSSSSMWLFRTSRLLSYPLGPKLGCSS